MVKLKSSGATLSDIDPVQLVGHSDDLPASKVA